MEKATFLRGLHHLRYVSSVRSREFCSETLESKRTSSLAALRARLAAGGPDLQDFLQSKTHGEDGDAYSVEVGTKKNPIPKPPWMRRIIPGGDKYTAIKAKLRDLNLHTVCEEAKCPNIGECWTGGETGTATATIMILGDTCTRGCRLHERERERERERCDGCLGCLQQPSSRLRSVIFTGSELVASPWVHASFVGYGLIVLYLPTWLVAVLLRQCHFYLLGGCWQPMASFASGDGLCPLFDIIALLVFDLSSFSMEDFFGFLEGVCGLKQED